MQDMAAANHILLNELHWDDKPAGVNPLVGN